MNLQRVWWMLGVMIVAAALVVCLLPSNDLPESLEWNDKLSHATGHCLLALYFTGLVRKPGWWKIFVFLLVFGIVVELAQYYMRAGREGDPIDVLANSCGAAVGLVLGWLGLSRWPQFAGRLLGHRATQ
jgi:VanZ family protein